MARLGVYHDDVKGGSTDRGGENMGQEGIHNLFTENCATYVRRRCIGRISWRVTDAGISEMEPDTWVGTSQLILAILSLGGIYWQ